MGDRISISFINGAETSVALFSHWDGMELVQTVEKWSQDRRAKYPRSQLTPLDRRQPQTCMVDFVCFLLQQRCMDVVVGNYYLGINSNDGDNSDEGHWTYNLRDDEWMPNDWRGFCKRCDRPIHFKHKSDRLCDNCEGGL